MNDVWALSFALGILSIAISLIVGKVKNMMGVIPCRKVRTDKKTKERVIK
jgi:hypothetical protein